MLFGVTLSSGLRPQQEMPLAASLDESVPVMLAGHAGHDLEISEMEQRVAGMSEYVLREYRDPATGTPAFSIYVGYYPSQTQGRTIHSPKNCLPGAGWEPLAASTTPVQTAEGQVTVNQYLIQNGEAQALVLYWYQGRGRVAANEYRVKFDLLRDAALQRRSEEALVRVVVPVTTSQADAERLARTAAGDLVTAVATALPG